MSSSDEMLASVGADNGSPGPGERCTADRPCGRRIPKPRTSTSPDTRRVVAVLPTERADSVIEALDALQELCAVDPHSYPRGHLLEALTLLGAQHREELKTYFEARFDS